jgi:hypothetical protein
LPWPRVPSQVSWGLFLTSGPSLPIHQAQSEGPGSRLPPGVLPGSSARLGSARSDGADRDFPYVLTGSQTL